MSNSLRHFNNLCLTIIGGGGGGGGALVLFTTGAGLDGVFLTGGVLTGNGGAGCLSRGAEKSFGGGGGGGATRCSGLSTLSPFWF